MVTADVSQLIEQLSHKSSPKRRAAAKKLRNLNAKKAGPALLEALQNELKDRRTWETQYQMIMALGESGYIESMNFLRELSEKEFEATMIYVAIGDAVTTLEVASGALPVSLERWIDFKKKELVDGCLRSIAIRRITPSDSLIKKIIQYATLQENQDIQFWAVAGAPGWPKILTAEFLHWAEKCAQLEETKRAAKAALNGKYLRWNPL